MATASSSLFVGTSSAITNYVRLGLATQNELPNILRELLFTKEPPHLLEAHLKYNSYLSRNLKAHEWNIVRTVRTNQYNEFDVPLMYKIIRNLNLVPRPTRGWDNPTPPLATEITVGDDIERIRRLRNEIVHRGNTNVHDHELSYYFSILKELASRLEKSLMLSKREFVSKIETVETCCIDNDAEQLYIGRLKELGENRSQLVRSVHHVHGVEKDLLDSSPLESKMTVTISQLQEEMIGIKTEQMEVIPKNVRAPSQLFLSVKHVIIQYEKKTFPRFYQTQQHIREAVNSVRHSVDIEADYFKWAHEMKDPKLVLCYGNRPPSIYLNTFAVHVSFEKQIGRMLDPGVNVSAPFLLICVIESNGYGKLINHDKSMLSNVRVLSEVIIENILFVVDQPEDSLKGSIFSDLSEEITNELELGSNDICHRLLGIHNREIGIRASLYLEKQMLNTYATSKIRLKESVINVEKILNIATQQICVDNYRSVLYNGSLDNRESLFLIERVASEYRLDGSSTTRLKCTVDALKSDITQSICSRLGTKVAETLISRFRSNIKESNLHFTFYHLMNIDMSDIQQNVKKFAQSMLIEVILEGVLADTKVVTIYLFDEHLKDMTFRIKIAKKVHEQLMENKEKIINGIVTRFQELQLNKFTVRRHALNRIVCATSGQPDSSNETDCFYHELKIIARRRDDIRAFGYNGTHFCVYVHNSNIKSEAIKNYLLKYLMKARQIHEIEICEYKEIKVVDYSKLQSGDRVVKDPVKNKYGTVGFLLQDKREGRYCATCRHVTLGVEANQIQVRSLDGSINTAIIKYEPSTNIDFAVLKLHKIPGSLSARTGLRNRNNNFVPGQVFMPDEFTLTRRTPVYKWGSTTNLTTGFYRETYEMMHNTEEESYPLIVIENSAVESFAEKGDSGSLACFTRDESEVAAFLVIGAIDVPNCFACCRIADGLSLITKTIPDITHLFKTEHALYPDSQSFCEISSLTATTDECGPNLYSDLT